MGNKPDKSKPSSLWTFQQVVSLSREIGTVASPTPREVTGLLHMLSELSDTSSICDLGCGAGAFSIPLARHSGAAITAVDIAEDALNAFSQNAHHYCPDTKVTICKNHLMRFSRETSNCFDLVLLLGGLVSHLETSEIEELLAKTLKPGGLAAISLLTRRNINYYEEGGCRIQEFLPEDVRFQYENSVLYSSRRKLYSETEFEEMMSKLGYSQRLRFRSTGTHWDEYYALMYQSASSANPTDESKAVRSTAIDETYYKMRGQKYLDYSVFIFQAP